MNGKEILYNAFKSKDAAKETMGRLGIIAARGVCIKFEGADTGQFFVPKRRTAL